jgi:tRNA(fMet)-specific endonuclease VapC
MTYLLDTNTCIRLLNDVSTFPVAVRLAALQPTDIRLCTIVESELYYGAYRSNRQQENLVRLERFLSQFTSLPFNHAAANPSGTAKPNAIGQIRAQLAATGNPIGANDLLIAAIAIANNLIVVTNNVREFSRVVGLAYEDWQNP